MARDAFASKKKLQMYLYFFVFLKVHPIIEACAGIHCVVKDSAQNIICNLLLDLDEVGPIIRTVLRV